MSTAFLMSSTGTRGATLLRLLLAALVLSLMSLSGVHASRAIRAEAGPASLAPSSLIKSVATHAADSGDQ